MALTMPGRSAGCSRGCSRGVTNVPQPRVTRTRFTQVDTGIQRGSTVTELGMPGSPEITGRMPTGGVTMSSVSQRQMRQDATGACGRGATHSSVAR